MELDQACAVIERDRADAERESRMTSAVREAATAANLWALAAPREVGGEEQTLVELARTFERLGHADPAFSWIAMNSLTLAHTSAKLPAAVREEVYAIRDAPYGLSGAITYTTARRVDGGLRIDGDWRFVTGSADARWMIANTLIDGETELGVHGVVIPMTDTIVSDTWRDASSMRGTGSNAVRASRPVRSRRACGRADRAAAARPAAVPRRQPRRAVGAVRRAGDRCTAQCDRRHGRAGRRTSAAAGRRCG